MQKYEQNKMDFMRVWLSASSINGSQWTSWASSYLPQDSYLPGVSLDTQTTFNGADVSLRLDAASPCVFADFWQGGVPAEPNTQYSVSARVKVSGLTGPANSGPYGFLVKQAGWLNQTCDQVNGTPITPPLAGTSGWVTVTGTYLTGPSQDWLDNFYLARQNATAGAAYVDDVRVWRTNDPAKVNLLREPNANSHTYFDEMSSAQWDAYIQSAQNHGVYLKLVIDEKNEWIRNHIDSTGAMTATASNDNFYAAPNTKVRWLQQAWWRYLIARWGYSTAVHSFEYINEGDPYDGNDYNAANAMATYMHQIDPAHHMVSTSFWADFPNQEFWSNPADSAVDYADLHAYISTGWGDTASFLPSNWLETRPAYIHSGNASAHIAGTDNSNNAIVPRGLVVHGPGEWTIRYWMMANAFTANCPYGTTGGMQRMRWLIDGGAYNGGSEGVVPNNTNNQDWVCTSPAGSFAWRQFDSAHDENGNLLPASARLILTDSAPHEISLRIENSNGTGGDAWFDDVQLVSPSGQVVPVIGQFDNTPMDEDTAWYNYAYAMLEGGGSPVGAHKPLVRGETGVDTVQQQQYQPDLLKDTQGIWLHNNVWGQINPGGMPDLMWWAAQTIDATGIYTNYLTFRNFMSGIPLNNGHYQDAQAQTSDPNLRAWGQRDDVNGRMHLWIQNMAHTWKRVVNGPAITPISGTITLANVTAGTYQVTWWNTYATGNPVFLTQTISVAAGQLTLTLPAPLLDDVGVQIQRMG